MRKVIPITEQYQHYLRGHVAGGAGGADGDRGSGEHADGLTSARLVGNRLIGSLTTRAAR